MTESLPSGINPDVICVEDDLYYYYDNDKKWRPGIPKERRKWCEIQIQLKQSKKKQNNFYRWNDVSKQLEYDYGKNENVVVAPQLTEEELNNANNIDFSQRRYDVHKEYVSHWKVVPRKAERVQIITDAHHNVSHMRIHATVGELDKTYHWQGMRNDVEYVLKSCIKCQEHNRGAKSHDKYTVPLKMHVARGPHSDFYMDCAFMSRCTRTG